MYRNKLFGKGYSLQSLHLHVNLHLFSLNIFPDMILVTHPRADHAPFGLTCMLLRENLPHHKKT